MGGRELVWRRLCGERGVIGELGEFLALEVTVAVGEEVVGRLGGLIGVDGIIVVGLLRAPS